MLILPIHKCAMQDYLVCEMQNIVSQAETEIVNDMTQTQLNTFNAFIDNTITTLTNKCGALNCLNTSDLAPSQRNAAVNNNCVSGTAHFLLQCHAAGLHGMFAWRASMCAMLMD